MEKTHSLTLISQNEAMRNVLARVDTIANSDSSVLLIGETGVGKELFAEYIHQKSTRATGPLVKIGLAELPPELLESELFGHDKGAYTSAHIEKKGLFELANTGSIFLDDIDDFPFSLQSKLLRVLESHAVKRVGGTISIPLDVRLISASKIDLKALVDRGIFRSDLFYRINVVPIIIPPLRERRDDIPLLVNHYLQKYAPEKNLTVCESAMRSFVDYDWPGNVRELKNIVQRIALFAKEEVQANDLPAEVTMGSTLELITKACHRCFTTEQMSFDQVVGCLEVNLLHHALDKTSGNRTQAAQILKMSPSTFRDKLKKYNLDGNS